MTIHFGLQYDDLIFKIQQPVTGGVEYVGPTRLLHFFEKHLGFTGHDSDNEYLRIEQFRQVLEYYLERDPQVFYANSFEADELATANLMLEMRDELLLNNWDFKADQNAPVRLQVMAALQAYITNESLLFDIGFVERFKAVEKALLKRTQPIKEIHINEPFNLLPVYIQRLFKFLESQGVQLVQYKNENITGSSDLHKFQQLIHPDTKFEQKNLNGDGSLMILKAKRETDAATYLATLLQKNKNFRPHLIIPEKNRALDNAFIQEGLPSLGILSASLARPSLQILKLVTCFFWEPIDPFKIMEFVSLSVKPLQEDLASEIADQISKKPGIRGNEWLGRIHAFWDYLEERVKYDRKIKPKEVKWQYNFWFERKRYHINSEVPKQEVIEVFDYLHKWALKAFNESESTAKSLTVLSSQARKVREFLEALPESKTALTNLELERVVRTIYEPSPIKFSETQVGFCPYVHNVSAFADDVDELLWWNFNRMVENPPFPKWSKVEVAYLEKKGVPIESPNTITERRIWQKKQPILRTKKRVVLIIPGMINGSEVHPHSLNDELMAAFPNLNSICYSIDNSEGKAIFEKQFDLPTTTTLPFKRLGKPKPYIQINSPEKLAEKETETFSSLESMFYYPHKYLFRYRVNLKKSSILSIVKDATLKGNLSHRFFELLMKDYTNEWTKEDVYKWVDARAPNLLAREGAVLLMYGREPEKVAFLNRVKYAAWSLVFLIQTNMWKVVESEMKIEGKFVDVPIKGVADLVLERGRDKAVIDLKWKGSNWRKNLIRNREDLQLVIYSKLLAANTDNVHSAFFIIQDGTMIGRNNLAFTQVTGILQEEDHKKIDAEIWQLMKKTYQWRVDQLKEGRIEVRTEQTVPDLDLEYGEESLEVLEMKNSESKFDEYRVLINCVE